MNDLHLSLTEFRNESRILKEISTLEKTGLFSKIFVAALHADGLKLHEKISDTAEVHRFNLVTRNLPRNFIIQLLKYCELVFRLLIFCQGKKIKIVHAHTLLLLPAGWLIKRIFNAILIYDTHELETEIRGLKGGRKKLAKILERVLISRADLIVVVSERIANWYSKEYKIKKPVVLMNSPRYSPVQKTEMLRERLGIGKDHLILLYQGVLSPGRGIELILSTFSTRKNDKFKVIFMGYGSLENAIKKFAEENKNIFFHPAVLPESVLELTASADIGILLTENSCLSHDFSMPNKLFEYAMAGLPVIVSDIKEASDFVKKYEMGWILEEANVVSLGSLLDGISDTNFSTLITNARLAAKKCSWEHQEVILLSAYAPIFQRLANDCHY